MAGSCYYLGDYTDFVERVESLFSLNEGNYLNLFLLYQFLSYIAWGMRLSGTFEDIYVSSLALNENPAKLVILTLFKNTS